MFVKFFYLLKSKGVPVTLKEWIILHQAMEKDLADSSLYKFYYLARAILVKTETHFDQFDEAFSEYFHNLESFDEFLEDVLMGLERFDFPNLTEEEKDMLDQLDFTGLAGRLGDLMAQTSNKPRKKRNFKVTYTGKNNPLSMNTYNVRVDGLDIEVPSDMDMSGVSYGGRSALQIADARTFRNYRSDRILDTRQLRVALSMLKDLKPEGPEDFLNLEKTIDATCNDAGELHFVWERDRKDKLKVYLMMDVGGSMTPHNHLLTLMFSSAKAQFKELKYYYFHNCIYDAVWEDAERRNRVMIKDICKNADPNCKLFIVGDASMAPQELEMGSGSFMFEVESYKTGKDWLQILHQAFPASVWINPDPIRYWNSVYSTKSIKEIFPMYELTLDGLHDAIHYLKRKR